MSNPKIKIREEIRNLVKEIREKDNSIKIVTTNGAFDILHSGHVESLKKAKSFGDILIIGLNSDKSIKKYKSPERPIIPQDDRAKLLAALEIVDYVVIFDEIDPRELLKEIKPDFHVKSREGYKGVEGEVVRKGGGKIILIKDFPVLSTTDIINKIKSM